MASAGTVTVDFAAETAKFTAELKKVQSSLSRMEGDFKRLDRVAGVALRFFSTAALTGFAKQAFSAADAIGDAADRAGIAVESFSRLKFAAEQTDVEFTALTTGIRKFQIELSKGAEGGSAAFSQIGLSAARLKDLAPEQQLAAVAEAFRRIKSPADQARVAADLFGSKTGTQLVPLLREGAVGIKRLTDEADRLGITMSSTTAEGVDQADKALKRLTATLSSFAARFVAGLSIVVLGPPDEMQKLDLRMRELTERQRQLLGGVGGDLSLLPAESPVRTELKAIGAELDALRSKWKIATGEVFNDKRFSRGPLSRNPQVNALPPVTEFDLDAIRGLRRPEFDPESDPDVARARAQEEFRTTAITLAEELAKSQKDIEAGVTADLQQQFQIRTQHANDYRDRMFEAETSILALRESAVSNGLRALQAFAGGSKKVAIALVLINKARAIAETIQLGAVAVMQAAASAPPPYNAPAIAWAKTLTALNVAAIAATGFGEIRSIQQSGGAPPGSAVNPINTTSIDEESAGATSQRSVQVIIQGNVIGNQQFLDQLIEDIKEAVDDRDVVLISTTSRNAKDLVGA